MPVTLKEVAERAGVSRSAVSRTFTEGASVSARTRGKVELAAAELGYAPSLLASGLTTGRTKLIGLVSNNFRNPVFLQIFDLFTRGLQDRGLRPLIVNIDDLSDPASAARRLRQHSVDGVILASSSLSPAFAEAFRLAGVPVVHAFGRASGETRVHVLGVDNHAIGRMAARSLVRRGYRNVAFLGGPRAATTTEDRLAGFAAVIARHPAVTMTVSFATDYAFEAGRSEMTRLLVDRPHAEAYFCGDDILAIGALSALRDAGLSVPGHVGVLGVNDMDMAGWPGIDLTTIRQPIDAIIDASVELAIAAAERPEHPPERRIFGCRLVERATLKPTVSGRPAGRG